MTTTCKKGVDNITCFVDKTSLTINTDEKCLILSDVESVESSIYAASSSRFSQLSSFSHAICLSILGLISFLVSSSCRNNTFVLLSVAASFSPSFLFFLDLITCVCSCLCRYVFCIVYSLNFFYCSRFF